MWEKILPTYNLTKIPQTFDQKSTEKYRQQIEPTTAVAHGPATRESLETNCGTLTFTGSTFFKHANLKRKNWTSVWSNSTLESTQTLLPSTQAQTTQFPLK